MPENSPSPSGEKKWFYHENDQALGPYSIQDLRKLVEFGKISATTWIAEAGAADWKPLSSVLSSEGQVSPLSPPTVPPQTEKPSQAKEGIIGCLFLILICAVPTFLFFKCSGGENHAENETPKRSIERPSTTQANKPTGKFEHVIDGNDRILIGGAFAENLEELVEGIYEGTIPESEARKCIVLGSAISQSSFGFENTAGDRLIYEGSVTYHKRFKFAVIRDTKFEKGGRGDDLIHYGDLVFVTREEFTTQGGLILSIPVFKAVNLSY